MPYRTGSGTHYHMTYGCCRATISCGTEGLEPCSRCCGRGGDDGASSGGSAAPAQGGGESEGVGVLGGRGDGRADGLSRGLRAADEGQALGASPMPGGDIASSVSPGGVARVTQRMGGRYARIRTAEGEWFAKLGSEADRDELCGQDGVWVLRDAGADWRGNATGTRERIPATIVPATAAEVRRDGHLPVIRY